MDTKTALDFKIYRTASGKPERKIRYLNNKVLKSYADINYDVHERQIKVYKLLKEFSTNKKTIWSLIGWSISDSYSEMQTMII